MTLSLQEISDRLEIQDLLVAYSYAVDTRDWDALDELFTADAVIDHTEMGDGRTVTIEIDTLGFVAEHAVIGRHAPSGFADFASLAP